jgi:hypothetical protein
MTSALWVLDILGQPPQNNGKLGSEPQSVSRDATVGKMMMPSQPSQSSQQRIGREQCRHPQVQLVSRDEETEYLKCRECGEVFESSELKDMAIEEKIAPDEE